MIISIISRLLNNGPLYQQPKGVIGDPVCIMYNSSGDPLRNGAIEVRELGHPSGTTYDLDNDGCPRWKIFLPSHDVEVLTYERINGDLTLCFSLVVSSGT